MHDHQATNSFASLQYQAGTYLLLIFFTRGDYFALTDKGLKLITRTRKNMKPIMYSSLEKQLLDQRGIIETVINHFKHHYHVWHTRHRSVINAMTHLMAAIAAYAIEPLKISAIKLLSFNPCLP